MMQSVKLKKKIMCSVLKESLVKEKYRSQALIKRSGSFVVLSCYLWLFVAVTGGLLKAGTVKVYETRTSMTEGFADRVQIIFFGFYVKTN